LYVVVKKERRNDKREKKIIYTSGDTPLVLECCFCLPIAKVMRMILWLNVPRDEKKNDQEVGCNGVIRRTNIHQISKKKYLHAYSLEPDGYSIYDLEIKICAYIDIPEGY
jgi:cytidylate kinase